MSSEKEKLLGMEKILASSVVGQTEAVKAVAHAIRLSRSGLTNPQRPIASFLLAGPSGTGKTLLAKTVCNFSFWPMSFQMLKWSIFFLLARYSSL
jgi:ATP-dependent Clp protease ATP-binding subunit ClpA